jgi:uncharacterized membrane protein YdjX (TVP38/TMEM64 family)
LAEPAGSQISLTAASVGEILFALVVISAGVEAIRCRHFVLAFLVPALLALLALVNLACVLQTGRTALVTSVVIMVLVVALVGFQRSTFV